MTDKRLNIKNELNKRKIKPSFNRIKVLEYLLDNQNHPTVDEIYSSMKKELPTLSKATIYNTLKVFKDANLVRVVSIEDNETRYDINIEDHGHFKCETCGAIVDFEVDMSQIVTDSLEGFIINDKNVYLKGICNRCKNKEANKDG